MIFDRERLEELHRGLDPARRAPVGALLQAAERALREERLDDADTILEGALVSDPENSATWTLAGRLAEEQGSIDDAELAYRTAIELEQDHHATLALAQLLTSTGRWDEAYALADWLSREGTTATLRRSGAELAEVIERRRSAR